MGYKVMLESFQKEISMMNLELMNKNKKDYDMAIIVAYTLELDKGFVVSRQGKTTRKGTKFTYKACKSEAELERYKLKLDELLNNYNLEYGTEYIW